MTSGDLPFERVFETLHHGMRLFHDGLRDAAMQPLASVLRSPEGYSGWRLAAAGLLAESYRGRGDFLRAEHYYRIALAEADATPPGERRTSVWYLHYRPRCALGMITALRRLISSDHRTITTELRTTRDLAVHLTIEDLPWQLSAVEGVYRRQQGDLDGAASTLREAYDGMAALDGFCFWYPEHVAALLLQVQLLTCSGRALVRRGARELLDDPSVRPWSKAVAAACHLHLQLDRMAGRGATPAEFAGELEDHGGDGPGHLLEVLETSAREERDPLLESEWLVLRLAWHLAAARSGVAAEIASELLDIETRTPPILGVLRSCEVKVVASLFSRAARAEPALAELARRGSEALRFLHASIASYGYGPDTVAACAELLATGASARIVGWLDGPQSALRCLAWP